jgi:hypothetical protein
MAKDLSNLAPTSPGGTSAPSAPAAFDPYKGPPQSEEDYIALVSTWVKALGRKAEVEDIQREPVPFRNALIKGAQVYLARYKGDFEFLVDLRSRLGSVRNGRRVLGYPSLPQAKGVLNCLRAEINRGPGTYRGAPVPAGAPTAQSVQAEPARVKVEDEGVYVLPDGTVCKVQANKEKTRTYAKRWTPVKHLDRLMEAGQHEHGEYVYEQGLVQRVAAEGRKMTLAEAKAHSIRYGRCVRCGRQLTDGKSVEQGMGPVCITYFGGP